MIMDYGSPMTFLGGCIRLDPGGMYIHENDSHAAVGIKSIGIDRHFLQVNFTDSAPVVAIIVSVDETIGGYKGITAGGSGGAGNVKIAFFDAKLNRRLDMSNPADYDRIASSLSNIWLLVAHLKT